MTPAVQCLMRQWLLLRLLRWPRRQLTHLQLLCLTAAAAAEVTADGFAHAGAALPRLQLRGRSQVALQALALAAGAV